jgi:hypothetical protein
MEQVNWRRKQQNKEIELTSGNQQTMFDRSRSWGTNMSHETPQRLNSSRPILIKNYWELKRGWIDPALIVRRAIPRRARNSPHQAPRRRGRRQAHAACSRAQATPASSVGVTIGGDGWATGEQRVGGKEENSPHRTQPAKEPLTPWPHQLRPSLRMPHQARARRLGLGYGRKNFGTFCSGKRIGNGWRKTKRVLRSFHLPFSICFIFQKPEIQMRLTVSITRGKWQFHFKIVGVKSQS